MWPLGRWAWLLLGGLPAAGWAAPLDAFATDHPPFLKAKHPLPPSALLSSTLRAPYPTNEWWQDAVLEDGSNPIVAEPYHLQLLSDGVLVALNRKVVSANTMYMHSTFTAGLSVHLAGGLSHEVVAYDLLSFTAQYHRAKPRAPVATIPIVRGAPYLTVLYNASLPLRVDCVTCSILAAHSDRNVHGIHKMPSNTITGTIFTLYLNTSQTWMIFTPIEVALRWSDRHLESVAPMPAGASVRLAAHPDTVDHRPAVEILTRHAHCVPTACKLETDVGDTEATVRLTWGTVSTAGPAANASCVPLMTALPHMQALLVNRSHSATALRYDSLLGPLVANAAPTWRLRVPLPAVSWFAARPIADDMREDIARQLAKDVAPLGFAPEPYSFGKQVSRLARLSLIAEELGLPDLANKSDRLIRDGFARWQGTGGPNTLVFDETWYGIVPEQGLRSASSDFGAGYYNDHHFHYGYWLYAAAVVARHDPEWARHAAPYFVALARDIANPSSQDPFFPQYRYFDWYAGHSWASGLMAFTSGRNQESTSEAINAWYAMQLFGDAIGDPNVRDTGRLLLALELEAARTYWRSTTVASVYPPEIAKHKGIGMVWQNKVDVATWFGAGLVYALGINIMPFTPATELYLAPQWVRETIPLLEQALGSGGYGEEWHAIVYMTLAQVDLQGAKAKLRRLSMRGDDGMTQTNVLWWLATRAGDAEPEETLPADMPLEDSAQVTVIPPPLPPHPLRRRRLRLGLGWWVGAAAIALAGAFAARFWQSLRLRAVRGLSDVEASAFDYGALDPHEDLDFGHDPSLPPPQAYRLM